MGGGGLAYIIQSWELEIIWPIQKKKKILFFFFEVNRGMNVFLFLPSFAPILIFSN